MDTIAKPKMGYRAALDGVRAFAIGLVLLEHTGLHLFDGGNSGVIVFFVLSGFLITKLMLEEWAKSGDLDVKAFYMRRTLRILPAPTVLIIVLFALSWFLFPVALERRYLWFELFMVFFYLTNLRPVLFGDGALWNATFVEGNRMMAHTWTLSIEEHFYFIWPWVVRKFRLPERSASNVARGLLWGAFAIAVSRYLLHYFVDPDYVSISLFTFDGFAVGAALAFVVHGEIWHGVRSFLTNGYVFCGASLLFGLDLLLRKQDEGSPYLFFTYCIAASVVLILYLYDKKDGWVAQIFAHPFLVFIGKLSYSIYLWHVPIQLYFSRDRFPDWSLWEIIVVEQTLTFIASYGSYKIVEMPALRLKKRYAAKDKKVKVLA